MQRLSRVVVPSFQPHREYAKITPQLDKMLQIKEGKQEEKRILITGGLGQLGINLAKVMRGIYGENSTILTDIKKLGTQNKHLAPFQYLDILDKNAIEEAVVNNDINTIVHFSALLSAVGENNVPLALQVNCLGVQNVLETCKNHKLQCFIPSTIGAFGPTTPRDATPDLTIQRPRTIYGVSKVYAELLGEYYHARYNVDFRSLRFPGIISATAPGGGTTDWVIQIFYDAIKYGKHVCFLSEDTALPMMYDSDCMASVVMALAAPSEQLSMRTYNITGFSVSPGQMAKAIKKRMPNFEIEYDICPMRQKIADSWPRSLDDHIATRDWGWKADYCLDKTIDIMFQLVEKQLAGEVAKTGKLELSQ
uniref:Epimerase domain-containing protein n=1 Tax=Rhabditophanes sp. KR3021 TaxID=114890 RepID=A0AC35UHY6_9BILA